MSCYPPEAPGTLPRLEAGEMIAGFLGVAPTTGDLAAGAATEVMLGGIGATDAESNRGKGFCRTGTRQSSHNRTTSERK
jgi:hypothetical protein